MRSINKKVAYSLLAAALVALSGCESFSFKPSQPAPPSVEAGKSEPGKEVAAQEQVQDEVPVSINPYTLNRPTVANRARQRFNAAKLAMKQNQWAVAMEHLTWLTQEYPKFSGPFLNLAIVQQQLGDMKAAEFSYLAAIKVNSANIDAYNQFAILLREQGRFSEAENLYIRALKVWQDHPSTHLNLGILYDLYMGKLDKALQHYQSYQQKLTQPDRQVSGWIIDIQRRMDQVALK